MNNLAVLTFLPVLTLPLAGRAQPTLSPEIVTLARTCAPAVHPLTIAYLVSAESRNSQFAINVNGGNSLTRQPTTEQEARDAIAKLDARGWNYDVGFAQINSANFRSLGVTGTQLLNPCTNLHAGAQILGDCYSRAVRQIGEGQAALQRALSCYNTGNQQKGFANGYVARVVAQVRLKVPALIDGPIDPNGLLSDASTGSNNTLVKPALAKAQLIPSIEQTQPAGNKVTQLGEPGAVAQVESGAFSHPETGVYIRRALMNGDQ